MQSLVDCPGARLVFCRITSVTDTSFEFPKLTRTFKELYATQNEKVANDDVDALAKCIFDQIILVDVRVRVPCLES